ncbi:hypothetical protein OAO01_07245 [Oligoflexia bacterium]|nr:hypothetical protein [Oligoflexia bacterium]
MPENSIPESNLANILVHPSSVYAARAAEVPTPLNQNVQRALIQAAYNRIQKEGPAYAYNQAPTSPLAALSGNHVPGETRPSWLKQKHKCNQFIGDVLTEAGVAMPTYRMQDGSLHYMMAEVLPHQNRYFELVTSSSYAAPGDVIAIDYTDAPGASGGHLELITEINTYTSRLITAGAHERGAYLTDNSDLFQNATYNPLKKCWQTGRKDIYIIRPKLKLEANE